MVDAVNTLKHAEIRSFMKTGIFCITMAFLLLVTQSVEGQNWPTTRFVIVEGSPNPDMLDVLWSKPPLTPEVADDMKNFLNEVAGYLQSSFPPPFLVQNETSEDGTGGAPAYLVHFYKAGDDFGTARYVYSNSCAEVNLGTLHINATGFTKNGKITATGYVALAHELFHAIQRNTRVGKDNCTSGYGHWIQEGQAEAFGQDMAKRFRNKTSKSPTVRWGGRKSYGTNLYVKPNPGSKSLNERAYQTSSFWRYLAEAWHIRTSGQAGGGKKPGPDTGTDYGTDYRYLAKLMKTPFPGRGENAELNWINNWLKDNLSGGLYESYTDFVSVLAKYGRYRFKGSRTVEENEARWLNTVFGGKVVNGTPSRACKMITLKPSKSYGKVTLSLDKVATSCIRLDVGSFDTPKTFEILIIAHDDNGARHVRLALAGGKQVQLAAGIKKLEGNRAGTLWQFDLLPDRMQYLLLTNIAMVPANTRPQDVDVHIALGGHNSSEAPAPYQFTGPIKPRATSKTGTSSTNEAHDQLVEPIKSSTSGAGATTWEHKRKSSRCRTGSKWNYQCQASAMVHLTATVPLGMGPPGTTTDSSADLINGLMPSLSLQDMVAYPDYLSDTHGAKIDLTLPGVDYGFTGTVTDAMIRVSGGSDGPDLVSLGGSPVSAYPPCTYGPPLGQVTIDEFSPQILRGSYKATVIEAGSPRNVQSCPTKSIVKSISGRFIVAAPLMKDSRQEEDLSWLQQEAPESLIPFDMDFDPELFRHVPKPPESINIPNLSSGGFDASGQPDIEKCACTCEEFRQAMKITQDMMMAADSGSGQGGAPDAEAQRLMMCMGMCAAKVSDCRL